LLYRDGMAGWLRGHWDWVGAVCGALLGLFDYGLFLLMGQEELSPRPERFAMGLAVVFGLMGFFVGRLALARQRSARDAETIQRQLGALEAAQRSLVQQEKLAAVGRLAAGVAHEVRNPLGVIRASASMVQESFDAGEDRHRACQFICDESDRLNSLITTLLTFSRPSEPNWSRVSLDDVVDRALQLAAEPLRERRVRVERENGGAGAHAHELRADPDLLAQVVLDLVLNAAEAVADCGRVVVRTGEVDGRVSVEVADAGPGVAPEHAAQLFEPFFTTKARGTGLGLAMARRIAETHAGTLELAAGCGAGADGAGACFRLSVPRDPTAEVPP